MSQLTREPRAWKAWVILALTVAAPLLGGTTALWSQTFLCVATGLLFMISPPAKSLGKIPNLLLVALAGIALVAFLPANWFPIPAWRADLRQIGVSLPVTQSAQPWLTGQSTCLFWLGLAWTCYLLSYEWPGRTRERVWDGFCLGLLGLAAALTISYTFKIRIPFWPSVPEYGFFPNRNQTSNVMALAGILLYANAFQRLQRRRKQGWVWLAGLALICWALILNYSRGGIILFFLGIVVWHAWWLFSSEEPIRAKAIAWVPLAILFVMLLLAGGETLVRFTHGSSGLLSPEQNARIPIHRDAFQLWMQSPLLGIGLGNFRGVFTSARHYFISPSEAIHPESDWLWAAVELGGVAVALLALGTGIWLRHCFPFSPGSWARMRFAAFLCGIAFICHSFVDVSGHRLGSLWPALFLISTAINPHIVRRSSRLLPWSFRLFGLGFVAIGFGWGASLTNHDIFPTTATIDRLKTEIPSAIQNMDYERGILLASQGLTIAPLDWEFYHFRGVAEAEAYRPRREIDRDFAAARYLLPNWPDLWVKEGRVWLALDEPDLAFATWEEGMQRWPDNAPAIFSGLYSAVQDDADLRDRWRKLGESDQRCLPALFAAFNSVEFAVELERILGLDPELRTLTRPEQRALFSAWYRVGDRLDLVRMVREHPAWEDMAWREWAHALADFSDYEQACRIVTQHIPPMVLPAPASAREMDALAAQFRLGRASEHEGLVLAVTQDADGRTADALDTLGRVSSNPRSSKVVYFALSQWRARQGEWRKSWDALSKCIPNGS